MQRSVLLAACAVLVVAGGAVALRGLTRHEAGQALDQNIDQLLTNLPPGTTVRHGTTDYNPLTGMLTVHDLAVTRAGGTAWSAATVTVTGADQRALTDVFDPAAYPAGKPAWTDRRLLLSDVTARHIQASSPGPQPGTFSAESVELHRLSGRPFAQPPTPEAQASRIFAADAALAFAFGSATARDVTLTVGGATPAKLALASASLERYDSGRLGALELKSIGIDGQAKTTGTPTHLTIEGLGIKDADAGGLLQAARRDGQASRAALAGFTYGAADLTGLAVQVPAGPAVTLHAIHARQTGSNGAGVREGAGEMHGLTVALGETAVPPSAAPGLAAFGLTALTMDLDVKSRMANAAKTAEIAEDFTLHDLGMLHVNGRFSGYDPAGAASGAPLAPVLAASIEHGSIVWEDAGLVERLFRVAAVQTHSTPDLVRAQLAMPIVALGVMVPDQPDAADQVTRFLNHPGTLTVTIAPPQPVTVGEVTRAPATARAHLLGAHIQAN